MPDDAAAKIGDADVFALRNGVRLQFEQSQNSWVLLYPEGMVQLSETAAEIMRRLDSARSVAALIGDLDAAYGADTRADVVEFLETARERRWIERR
jgi:pyrroloquinoline quinone biosynthesis protein D